MRWALLLFFSFSSWEKQPWAGFTGQVAQLLSDKAVSLTLQVTLTTLPSHLQVPHAFEDPQPVLLWIAYLSTIKDMSVEKLIILFKETTKLQVSVGVPNLVWVGYFWTNL